MSEQTSANLRSAVRLTINGKHCTVEPADSETLGYTLRERLGLTGTKVVCGMGVCGSCVVHLDGQPVVACLMRTAALEGRSVRTIEGLAGTGGLSRFQAALVGCDAVQCGYCTPGIAMSGSAAYDWVKGQDAGIQAIQAHMLDALASHLCRCGTYARLREAVAACASGSSELGSPTRRDGIAKVTGAAVYTTDVRYQGQLEAILVRSGHASGVVTGIDFREALAVPGVICAVRLLPAGGTVRYVGQELAAIAAKDRATAERAAGLVKVTCEARPAVIGAASAMRPGAVRVYEDRAHPPSADEGLSLPVPWHGNVHGPSRTAARTAHRARSRFAASSRSGEGETIIEGTWRTAAQAHTALEPHVCIAHWTPERLTVHLSTQAVGRMARYIAKRWRLPRHQIEVIADNIGGAFGAKQELSAEAIAAIELSRLAQTPVRVCLTREEELAYGGYRPSTEVRLALLLGPDGDLRAIRAHAISDAGSGVGGNVARRYGRLYGRCPRELTDYAVVSHLPPGKPMRAPGGPGAFWAMEQAVDEAAWRLGADPLELRRRWDTDPLRQQLYDWVLVSTPWAERAERTERSGSQRRGLGLAVASWPCYVQTATRVRVSLQNGTLRVAVAAHDPGTGTKTIVAEAIATMFAISPLDVEVEFGRSALPHGPFSAASSASASIVPAARDAARRLRDLLTDQAARQLGLDRAAPMAAGIAHSRGLVSWPDVIKQASPVTAVGSRQRDRGGYRFPSLLFRDFAIGRRQPCAVQVADVRVDLSSGRVVVEQVWCGVAAGRMFSTTTATSQVHGAVIQAIGHTLFEERLHDPATGVTRTTDLDDYLLPGLLDTPQISVGFLPGGFEHAPEGGVGMAEVAVLPTAPAIGNALFAATGRRHHDIPIQPADVLELTP